ncbi:MAG: hypothetical protein AB7P37_23075 [Ramlibacter sp.]
MHHFFVDVFGIELPAAQREAVAEAYYDALCGALGGPLQVITAYGEYMAYYEAWTPGGKGNAATRAKSEAVQVWPAAQREARAVALGPDLTQGPAAIWCSCFGDHFSMPGLPSRTYLLQLEGADELPQARQSTVLARFARGLDTVATGDDLEALWWASERALMAWRSEPGRAPADTPPATPWSAALSAAGATAWRDIELPAGAAITVRFTAGSLDLVPYYVDLVDAQDLPAPQRAALERDYRIALDAASGGSEQAARVVNRRWYKRASEEAQILEQRLRDSFADRLPAAAQFRCTPNFAFLQRPVAQ